MTIIHLFMLSYLKIDNLINCLSSMCFPFVPTLSSVIPTIPHPTAKILFSFQLTSIPNQALRFGRVPCRLFLTLDEAKYPILVPCCRNWRRDINDKDNLTLSEQYFKDEEHAVDRAAHDAALAAPAATSDEEDETTAADDNANNNAWGAAAQQDTAGDNSDAWAAFGQETTADENADAWAATTVTNDDGENKDAKADSGDLAANPLADVTNQLKKLDVKEDWGSSEAAW